MHYQIKNLLLAFSFLLYTVVLLPACVSQSDGKFLQKKTLCGDGPQDKNKAWAGLAGGILLSLAGVFCFLKGSFNGFFEDHDGTQFTRKNSLARMGKMMLFAGILGIITSLTLLF